MNLNKMQFVLFVILLISFSQSSINADDKNILISCEQSINQANLPTELQTYQLHGDPFFETINEEYCGQTISIYYLVKSDQNLCPVNKINISPLCANTIQLPDVKIGTIFIDQGNNILVNDPQKPKARWSYIAPETEISMLYFKNLNSLTIHNVILDNTLQNKTFSMLSISTNIEINNFNFINHIISHDNDVIKISGAQQVDINNIEILNNSRGGTIINFSSVPGPINIRKAVVKQNTPKFLMFYFYCGWGDTSTIIDIIDPIFENNKAQSAAISQIVFCHLYKIQGGKFISNDSQKNIYHFFAGSVEIKDSLFTKNTGYVSSLSINFGKDVTFENLIFEDNTSKVGYSGPELSQVRDTKIINCEFKNNKQTCLKINSFNSLTMEKNSFTNNIDDTNNIFYKALYIGQISKSKVYPVSIKECIFKNNKFYSGGSGIYIYGCQNCQGIIQDSIFEDNQTQITYGGAINLENTYNIKIERCTFLRNISGNSGGAISVQQGKQITIVDCKFQENSANEYGGGIFYQKDIVEVNIINNTFVQNSVAAGNGGAIYGYLGEKCTIEQNKFEKNVAFIQGAGCFIIYSNQQVMRNNLYINNISKLAPGLSMVNNQGGEIRNEKFLNNNAQAAIGALLVSKSQNMKLENIQIRNNYAEVECGGLQMEENDDISLIDVVVQDNKSQSNAGGILMKVNNKVVVKRLIVTNNIALGKGGGILSTSLSNSQFEDCKILENQAHKGAGGYFQVNDDVKFTNTDIQNNLNGKQGAGLYLINGNLLHIQNCIFQNNKASQFGGAIYMKSIGQIIINDSIFKNNTSNFNGGAIYGDFNKQISLQQLEFENNDSKYGGAVHIENVPSESVIVKDCNFKNNTASSEAGAILLQDLNDVSVSNCSFIDNASQNVGGSISAQGCGNIQINLCDFQNSESMDGGGVSITQFQQCEIYLSTFNNSRAGHFGGSLNVQSGDILSLRNIAFTNSTISQALKNVEINIQNSEQDLEVEKQFLESEDNTIINEYFSTSSGGAVHAQLINKLSIGDCKFENNYAFYKGGSVSVINAQHTQVHNSSFEKSGVHFDKNLSLYQKDGDYAISYGGGVFYSFDLNDDSEPSLDFQNLNFTNGQASNGGGVFIGCYKVSQNNEQNFPLNLTFENISFQNNSADVGAVARFLGWKLSKENLNIIQSSEMERNQNYVRGSKIIQYGYFYNEIKKIVNNEIFSELCERGTVHYKGGGNVCEQCFDNMVCEGGYIPMYPVAGFWRKEQQSIDIFPCFNNPRVCLGNDTCITGNTGILCELCDVKNNYVQAKNGYGNCIKCDESQKSQMIAYIIIFSLIFILLVFKQARTNNAKVNKLTTSTIIRKYFKRSAKFKSTFAGTMKIIISHFQILNILGIFKLNLLSDFWFSSIMFIGSPSQGYDNLLSCFLTVETEEDEKNKILLTLNSLILYDNVLSRLCIGVILVASEFLMRLKVKPYNYQELYRLANASSFISIISILLFTILYKEQDKDTLATILSAFIIFFNVTISLWSVFEICKNFYSSFVITMAKSKIQSCRIYGQETLDKQEKARFMWRLLYENRSNLTEAIRSQQIDLQYTKGSVKYLFNYSIESSSIYKSKLHRIPSQETDHISCLDSQIFSTVNSPKHERKPMLVKVPTRTINLQTKKKSQFQESAVKKKEVFNTSEYNQQYTVENDEIQQTNNQNDTINLQTSQNQ